MNSSDLLGALMQSGMAPSSNQRLQNAFGGGSGGLLESLGGLLGGQQGGGGLGDILSSALGGGGGGGGLGGMLGEVLNQTGQAAGGKQNLALGGATWFASGGWRQILGWGSWGRADGASGGHGF